MHRRGWLAATALALLCACAAPEVDVPRLAPALEFDTQPTSTTFGELRLATAPAGGEWSDAEREAIATSLSELQPSLLSSVVVWTGVVTTPESGCRHPAGQPPLLGRVEVSAAGLVFEPRFPWVAGLDYTACLDLARLAEALGSLEVGEKGHRSLAFSLPEPEATAPQVTAVWPEVDEIPANLLRLYVHFDKAMHRRRVAEHVRLLDASGEPIVEPFVDIPDGLWDAEGSRLTLFFHPGRIKRGVGPREVLGSVLEVGRSVTLEVGAGLETVRGVPLGKPFRVSYRVANVDRTRPVPAKWRVLQPRAADEALRLEFDEPLDRAQVETAIQVQRDGEAIRGAVMTEAAGRVWSFAPTQPWRPGGYRLAVARGLEDLAGNTMDRLFDALTTGERSAETSVVEPSQPRGPVLSFDFTLDFADG